MSAALLARVGRLATLECLMRSRSSAGMRHDTAPLEIVEDLHGRTIGDRHAPHRAAEAPTSIRYSKSNDERPIQPTRQLHHSGSPKQCWLAIGDVRLGDDEGVLLRIRTGAEGMTADACVVACPGSLEVGEVGGVVDVPQRIGVDVPDLDVVAVAKSPSRGRERGLARHASDASACAPDCVAGRAYLPYRTAR